MNILHVTPYYAPAYAFGGVVRAVEGMARALARRGHHVTVLTTDALSQRERYTGPRDEVLNGVRVVRAPNRSVLLRGRANLSTPRMSGLAREWVRWAEVIHVHEFRTVENLIVTRAASDIGRRMALSPHGTLTPHTGRTLLKRGWDLVFSRALAQRFHSVIALTEAEKRDIETFWRRLGLLPPRIHVVPNAIDPQDYARLRGGEAFRARYELGDSVVCLYLGRLHPRKGLEVLVRAFQAANVPNTRLVIAGPDEGMLEILRAIADERVVFTGYLEGEARLGALAAADVFALPATGEGLSMAALEAMGAGVPALLSPGSNLPEAEAAGAALIVEPRLAPLTDALRTLLADPARRRAMSAAARRFVQQSYTWENVAAQLEAIYAGLRVHHSHNSAAGKA